MSERHNLAARKPWDSKAHILEEYIPAARIPAEQILAARYKRKDTFRPYLRARIERFDCLYYLKIAARIAAQTVDYNSPKTVFALFERLTPFVSHSYIERRCL